MNLIRNTTAVDAPTRMRRIYLLMLTHFPAAT